MDGWKMKVPFWGQAYFQGLCSVSFPGCNWCKLPSKSPKSLGYTHNHHQIRKKQNQILWKPDHVKQMEIKTSMCLRINSCYLFIYFSSYVYLYTVNCKAPSSSSSSLPVKPKPPLFLYSQATIPCGWVWAACEQPLRHGNHAGGGLGAPTTWWMRRTEKYPPPLLGNCPIHILPPYQPAGT